MASKTGRPKNLEKGKRKRLREIRYYIIKRNSNKTYSKTICDTADIVWTLFTLLSDVRTYMYAYTIHYKKAHTQNHIKQYKILVATTATKLSTGTEIELHCM